MPLPLSVRLVDHDPAWPRQAQAEIDMLKAAIPALVEIHHIGSTSIPGICAKPILDRLRSDPGLVCEYCQMKRRWAQLHPDDSHDYADCKDAWIKRVEAMALAER